MRHIQYQGETLPPSPLVLAFHLVLGKFLTYPTAEKISREVKQKLGMGWGILNLG